MKQTNDLQSLLMEGMLLEKAKELGRLLGESDALNKEAYGTGIIVERIKNAANTSRLTPDLQSKVRKCIDIGYEAGWKSVTES
jgi:hypothetical protein